MENISNEASKKPQLQNSICIIPFYLKINV